MYSASPASPRSGFGGASTGTSRACSCWMTGVQKDASAKPPCTSTPALQFLPYLGDYNMLLSRGNEFLGIFSAGNTPDPANFPSGVVFQRRVSQATHQLLDASGSPVDVSIDPFFFSVPVMP